MADEKQGIPAHLTPYEKEIEQVADAIHSRNPDLIIALSRRDVRLLELLTQSGLWEENVDVLTEKSLSFMKDEQINGEEILIFSDTIISGQTLGGFLEEIFERYEVDVNIVTIAVDVSVDKPNMQIDNRTLEGHFFINGRKVPIDFQTTLTGSGRASFIRAITRGHTHLNKPFDYESCIFHLNCTDEKILAIENEGYEITTAFADEAGFRRYSVIANKEEAEMISQRMFQGNKKGFSILKMRIYYDESTGETRLVPIALHETSRKITKDNSLFDDVLFSKFTPHPNEFLTRVRTRFGNPSKDYDTELARLIHYLISYFLGEYFREKFQLDLSPPRKVILRKDLNPIFGPVVSEDIFDFMETNYSETESVMKDLLEGRG